MLKSFVHQNHVDLWNWQANNPRQYLDSWPEWKNFPLISGDINQDFACIAANGECENCPLEWPGGKCNHPTDGLFSQWYDLYCEVVMEGNESAEPSLVQIARKIRDRPIKNHGE